MKSVGVGGATESWIDGVGKNWTWHTRCRRRFGYSVGELISDPGL